jgi:hypothetical protein
MGRNEVEKMLSSGHQESYRFPAESVLDVGESPYCINKLRSTREDSASTFSRI